MIVTLLYKLSRTLLSVPAVVLRRESSNDAELLVLRQTPTASGSSKPSATSCATTFWSSTKLTPADSWPSASDIMTTTDPIRPVVSYHPTAINNRPPFSTYSHIYCDAPASSAG